MVTRKDVAEYAKVSTATVSYVISKKRYVNDELRERVEVAIEALGYQPNMLAQSLASNKSNTIALLVDELTNPYYMEMAELIDKFAREKNYFTDVCVIHSNPSGLMNELIRRRVDGIINLTLFGVESNDLMLLKNSSIKLTNFGGVEGTSVVDIDYSSSLKEYMDRLADAGYKRLAFIAGFNAESGQYDNRIKTYLQCRESQGFDKDNRLLVYGDYPNSKSYEIGYKGVMQLLESGVLFDSLFCMNDMTALGAMSALTHNGIHIPKDVSLLSCDNINISDYLPLKLSTIDVSKELMCRTYIEDIITRIENDDNDSQNRYTIPTKLVLRETTKI